MEYTELDDHPLADGLLTIWSPHTHETAWQADTRAVSSEHAAHLRGIDPQARPSWIGTVFDIHQPYDDAALASALTAWHRRHEALRTTVRVGEDGSLVRESIAPHDITMTRGAPTPIGDDVTVQVEDALVAKLSPHVWPHLAVGTIHDDERQHFLLIFAADHAVMDAYSQLIAVAELTALYEAALAGEDAPESLDIGPFGSFVEASAGEAVRVAELAGSVEVAACLERWRALLDDDGRPAALPRVWREAARRTPQRSRSHWLLDDDEAERYASAVKAAGHSSQTGVLGVFASAMRELTAEETLRFVLPMHTRHTVEDSRAIGWYVGLAPVTWNLGGAATPSAVLARVAEATAQAKQDTLVPFPWVREQLAMQGAPGLVVSYVDTRHVPGAAQFKARRARALRSRVNADDVYLWLVRCHGGFNVSMRYPDTLQMVETVEQLLASLRATMLRFAEADDLLGVPASASSPSSKDDERAAQHEALMPA